MGIVWGMGSALETLEWCPCVFSMPHINLNQLPLSTTQFERATPGVMRVCVCVHVCVRVCVCVCVA